MPADLPPSNSGFAGLTSGDPNGDAVSDLVDVVPGLGAFASGWVGVRLGLGDGSFQAPAFTPVGARPNEVIVAELNADSTPDVVVGHAAGPNPAGVSVLLGAGGGALEEPVFYTVANTPRTIGVGDLDGDSTADLIVACSTGVEVPLGAGDGSFGVSMVVASPFHPVSDVALADFDGDSQLVIGRVADPEPVQPQ